MRHREKYGTASDGREGPQHGRGKWREPAESCRIVSQRAQSRACRHPSLGTKAETPIPDGTGLRADRGRHRGRLTHCQQACSLPARRHQEDARQCRRPGCSSKGRNGPGSGRIWRPGDSLHQCGENRRCDRLPRQHGKALWPQRNTLCQSCGNTHVLRGAQAPGCHGGSNQGGRRRTEPSPSRRNRRRRGRSAASSTFDGSSNHSTPTEISVARNCAGGTVRNGRSNRRPVVSTSGAMPAMPAEPLPPSARICKVSA